MAEENKEDLKPKEDETSGDQSNSNKNDSEVAGDLKNKSEETAEQVAERLLKDGTPSDKEIKVKKKTYDDKNDKAKLYEAHAPLLEKVLQNPELVEQFFEKDSKDDVDERISNLEEERKADKRKEMRDALSETISTYPDFEKSWAEVQPIVASLTKSGLSFKEALRRGYLAVNPDAASKEAERIAREGVNALGRTSSSSSYSPKPAVTKDTPVLNEDQRKIFNNIKAFPHMPKTEEEYARLLEKHKDWLENNIRI